MADDVTVYWFKSPEGGDGLKPLKDIAGRSVHLYRVAKELSQGR